MPTPFTRSGEGANDGRAICHHGERGEIVTTIMSEKMPVLVTGATGYVGGRLVPRLLSMGYRVRAMGRSLQKMSQRKWACDPAVELVQGDVQNKKDLIEAARGCRAAYYLVHAMIAQKGRCRGGPGIRRKYAGCGCPMRNGADHLSWRPRRSQ